MTRRSGVALSMLAGFLLSGDAASQPLTDPLAHSVDQLRHVVGCWPT
ncbi:MAG: hypothetical protein ACT4QD_25025 [Acidobacteriota bacterium]